MEGFYLYARIYIFHILNRIEVYDGNCLHL